MKIERHAKIVDLIHKYEIETQDELAELLNKMCIRDRYYSLIMMAFALTFWILQDIRISQKIHTVR